MVGLLKQIDFRQGADIKLQFLGVADIEIVQIGAIIGSLYSACAIGQFFDKIKFINYVKAFFVYMLGYLTITLGTVLIGTLIDFIIK